VCVEGVPADALLLGLDIRGIAASSGSACSNGRLSASHVLTAMGVPDHLARGAVRLTMGHATTLGDVERSADALQELIGRYRELVAA
jgi:cysteine desulfurase